METLLEDYKRRLKSIREIIYENNVSKYPVSPIRLHQKESCYVEIERAIAREEERKLTNQPPTTMKILPHLKRILKIFREQMALALHDCDGMCKHCPEKYASICRCNSNNK